MPDKKNIATTAEAPESGAWTATDVLAQVARIEVEAVIGGALQRVEFLPGTNPAEVLPMLRALDPAAQVRDAFPTRGAFGGKETKLARALVISAEVKDSGAFIRLTCQGQDGEDLTASVSKKKAGEWPGAVEALGKLTERNVEKLRAAWEAKKPATIILTDPEQFGVRFWKTDDGAAFVDSLEAAAPEVTHG